jgi:hypothetical protein
MVVVAATRSLTSVKMRCFPRSSRCCMHSFQQDPHPEVVPPYHRSFCEQSVTEGDRYIYGFRPVNSTQQNIQVPTVQIQRTHVTTAQGMQGKGGMLLWYQVYIYKTYYTTLLTLPK